MKLYFLILIPLIFSGCDLFEIRDSEKPTTGKSNFRPAIEPQIVIENLINSFTDKNVQNYLNCFVDSALSEKKFNFFPSAEAVLKFPDLADGWNLRNEEQYFINLTTLLSEDVNITLSFDNPNISQIDTVVYTASYFINVPHNNEGVPKNYQGNVTFNMIRDNLSVFKIYYWQDNKTGNEPSWSELKGWYYN